MNITLDIYFPFSFIVVITILAFAFLSSEMIYKRRCFQAFLYCQMNRLLLTTLESEKQKEDRVSVLEKQMQSLISTLSKLTEQGQVNTVAQTLYSSGILKEGKEASNQ
jgi:hypothetical protein